jgi:methionyl-tRNA formyltransferase
MTAVPAMRVAFLGSGEFAVPALEHLSCGGARPQLVVTQPDRPSGRGRRPTPPPVHLVATRLGLPVFQPPAIGAPEALERLRAGEPDFLVVADYGQILPPAVLNMARFAAVNLHGSLLPRWRGAAPVARAILAGDTVTGVTTIRMDARVDTGDILLQEETPVDPGESAGELEARLAALGAPLVARTLEGVASGELPGRAQVPSGATRAPRLDVQEARLDWSSGADDLDRRVRAFSPWPVAWTLLEGGRVKIWRARPAAGEARAQAERSAEQPGSLLAQGRDRLQVACGRGFLELLQIQFPGGQPISAADAIHGRKIRAGQRFE